MMSCFKSMVSDGSGNVSSTRVIALVFYGAVTVIWGFIAIRTRSLPDIPSGVVALGGAIAALKMGQNFTER